MTIVAERGRLNVGSGVEVFVGVVGLLEFVQLMGGDDRCQDGGTGNHEKEAVEFLGFSSDGLAVASELTQSFLVCHA